VQPQCQRCVTSTPHGRTRACAMSHSGSGLSSTRASSCARTLSLRESIAEFKSLLTADFFGVGAPSSWPRVVYKSWPSDLPAPNLLESPVCEQFVWKLGVTFQVRGAPASKGGSRGRV
jgi:hypothetical protein